MKQSENGQESRRIWSMQSLVSLGELKLNNYYGIVKWNNLVKFELK